MTSKIDALDAQYRDIFEQMRGISPKLQLYKDLEAQLKVVKDQIGGRGVLPLKRNKINNKIKIKSPEVLKALYNPPPKKTVCNFPGCTNRRISNGRTSTGIQKYGTYCSMHRKLKRDAKKQ